MLSSLWLSFFVGEKTELGSWRCCRCQTQHFDRKDRDIFYIIFQGHCAAFTKVLMDFQSVLTAVFGDYHSGEGLTQWYLTWGSKGHRVIQTLAFSFFPLIVAECTISDRMEAFVQHALTTATKMTSHYLKDIWSSLLNYTRPPDNWLDLEFIFTEKDRWTIFTSQAENKPFHCEERRFVDWIDGFVQVRSSSRSADEERGEKIAGAEFRGATVTSRCRDDWPQRKQIIKCSSEFCILNNHRNCS